MGPIKKELGYELSASRMNNLCTQLLEETVSSANALIGVDSVVPEWFAIFNGESISQLEFSFFVAIVLRLLFILV